MFWHFFGFKEKLGKTIFNVGLKSVSFFKIFRLDVLASFFMAYIGIVTIYWKCEKNFKLQYSLWRLLLIIFNNLLTKLISWNDNSKELNLFLNLDSVRIIFTSWRYFCFISLMEKKSLAYFSDYKLHKENRMENVVFINFFSWNAKSCINVIF